MSIRENKQIFCQLDPQAYLEILKNEYGAQTHSNQADSFLLGDPALPFYRPQLFIDHISVLGFNYAPLSILLIQAIVDHPELVADEVLVRWTQEHELLLENTLGELREQFKAYDTGEATNS